MEKQKDWTDNIEPVIDKVKTAGMISAGVYCLYMMGAGICSLIGLLLTILAYVIGASLFVFAVFYSYNVIYN
tara:strand:- start:1468 stop:1683 length:216 start_codon:yes stop_codon:yes gene_type:complete